MKIIEVDDELYQYIASQTQEIGESASDILRRLLLASPEQLAEATKQQTEHAAVPARNQTQINVIDEDFLDHQTLAQQKGVIGRFLYILAALYRKSPQRFAQVLEIRGRNRLYFATSKEDLLAAGSSTNPKQIPGTTYWVISNTNTTKKRAILEEVCQVFRLADSLSARLIETL